MKKRARVPKIKRVWELDLIRGLILLLVTLDHLCGWVGMVVSPTTAAGVGLLSFSDWYLGSLAREIIQPLVIFSLLFMSGITGSLSRNLWKRALDISIIVAVFMLGHFFGKMILPDALGGKTLFNILAVMAISAWLWAIIEAIKVPNWALWAFAVPTALVGIYFLVFFIRFGYCELGLPQNLDFIGLLVYSKEGFRITPNNFEPLFPGFSFFLMGGIYGRRFYKERKTTITGLRTPKLLNPVLWIGKNSIWVYFVGPVVVLGLCYILNLVKVF